MANWPKKKKNPVAFVFEGPQWVPVVFDSTKSPPSDFSLKKKESSTAFF